MTLDEVAHFATPIAIAIGIGVAATLLVPRALAAMPADYFVRAPPKRARVVRVVRWIAGIILFVAGVAMLVLPGPGLVAIVLGLVVLDLPLVQRLLVRLLRRPTFAEAVNRVRERHGKPPLRLPPAVRS